MEEYYYYEYVEWCSDVDENEYFFLLFGTTEIFYANHNIELVGGPWLRGAPARLAGMDAVPEKPTLHEPSFAFFLCWICQFLNFWRNRWIKIWTHKIFSFLFDNQTFLTKMWKINILLLITNFYIYSPILLYHIF